MKKEEKLYSQDVDITHIIGFIISNIKVIILITICMIFLGVLYISNQNKELEMHYVVFDQEISESEMKQKLENERVYQFLANKYAINRNSIKNGFYYRYNLQNRVGIIGININANLDDDILFSILQWVGIEEHSGIKKNYKNHQLTTIDRRIYLAAFGILGLFSGISYAIIKEMIKLEYQSQEERVWRKMSTDTKYHNTITKLISTKKDGNNIISVTSKRRRGNQAKTIYNFAYELSNLKQNVLVIDLDFDRNDIKSIFNLETDLGISNYLYDDLDIEHVLANKNVYLDVIGVGTKQQFLKKSIQGRKFNELLEEFKEYYDYILINSPYCFHQDYENIKMFYPQSICLIEDSQEMIMKEKVSKTKNLRDMSFH